MPNALGESEGRARDAKGSQIFCELRARRAARGQSTQSTHGLRLERDDDIDRGR